MERGRGVDPDPAFRVAAGSSAGWALGTCSCRADEEQSVDPAEWNIDLADRAVASVLHEMRQAHLAIGTTNGPHVTPTLYAFDRRRLWFFAASTTVKARVVATGDRGGALVSAAGRALVVSGVLERIDFYSPKSLMTARHAFSSVPKAVASFGLRNAVDLAAFAGDAFRGRAGSLPPARRVLLSLRPDRLAIVERDRIVEVAGAWEGQAESHEEFAVGNAPIGREAVLGWSGTDGPLALPARWNAERGEASVLDSLLGLAGSNGDSRTAIVFDDYGRPGPAAKRGELLRGSAEVVDLGGGQAWRGLRITTVRRTTWNGIRTATEVA